MSKIKDYPDDVIQAVSAKTHRDEHRAEYEGKEGGRRVANSQWFQVRKRFGPVTFAGSFVRAGRWGVLWSDPPSPENQLLGADPSLPPSGCRVTQEVPR